MYIPKTMLMKTDQEAHEFIHQFGFGLIVSDTLDATHLPFILDSKTGELGTLFGHVAKANPHWKSLENQQVLIVFQGPHAYISPTWYESKPAVPTWNYSAVHVYGRIQLLNATETATNIDKLVEHFEPGLNGNTTVMDPDYVEKLSLGIVGFHVTITGIQGKHKLGQNKPQQDQLGVSLGLENSSSLESLQLSTYMKQTGLGTGKNSD